MHRVGYLITEGFQVMSLATQAVFEFANIVAGETAYKIQNFSIEGGTVRSSLGMYMDTLPLGAPGLADTWMITGTLTPLTPTIGQFQLEPIGDKDWERQMKLNAIAVLKRTAGKVSGDGGAAQLLGLKPTTLASRLKKWGVDPRHYK